MNRIYQSLRTRFRQLRGGTDETEVSSNRRRWPSTAEATRIDVIELAGDARERLGQARKALSHGDLVKAQTHFADAQTALADIQRLMVEAKVGK